MKRQMNEVLKQALSPAAEPSAQLNRQILHRAEEMVHLKKKKRRISIVAAAACLILVCGSVTAAAAFRYLSPAQVAEIQEDTGLQEAFSGPDTVLVNETQEFSDYRVTFLGMAAGKNISDYLSEDTSGNLEEDRMYLTVAIERTDGTPMPEVSSDDYEKEAFYVSPYIGGLDPAQYSIMSMGGGYGEFVRDGILYRLVELSNLEMFADHGIFLGVSSGTFYDSDAYICDVSAGSMTRNEDYKGMNALFSVPVDPNRADPARARKYLEELEESWNAQKEMSEETPEEAAARLEVEEWITRLLENPELLKDPTCAKPLESTRQISVPNSEGIFTVSWALESGAGGSAEQTVAELFTEKEAGAFVIGGYFFGIEGLADLMIETYELNADGTVTFEIYTPVLN